MRDPLGNGWSGRHRLIWALTCRHWLIRCLRRHPQSSGWFRDFQSRANSSGSSGKNRRWTRGRMSGRNSERRFDLGEAHAEWANRGNHTSRWEIASRGNIVWPAQLLPRNFGETNDGPHPRHLACYPVYRRLRRPGRLRSRPASPTQGRQYSRALQAGPDPRPHGSEYILLPAAAAELYSDTLPAVPLSAECDRYWRAVRPATRYRRVHGVRPAPRHPRVSGEQGLLPDANA